MNGTSRMPFRELFLAAALAASAYGQPLQCSVNAGVPTTIRTEGITEMAGDVVITCTGGTPTKAGAPVPQSDITIYLNTNVTSRVLATTSKDTWIEALLMIDEPHSTMNPLVPLLACGDGNAPDTSLSPGVCAMTGTGDGAAVYSGATNRPNVWQGRMNGVTSITWPGIPIDAPPLGGSRVIRITNVRLSSLQVPPPPNAQIPGQVGMSFVLGSSNPIPIVSGVDDYFGVGLVHGLPAAIVAFLRTSITSDVLYAASLQQNQSNNPQVATGASYAAAIADFLVRLTEVGPQSAFKRKNWGFSSTLSTEQNQNIPGAVYNTESGFENLGPAFDPSPNPPPQLVNGGGGAVPSSPFPAYHGLVNAGVADGGTHLMLKFANVPSGVLLGVPASINLRSQSRPFSTPPGGFDRVSGVAYLVSTDSVGVGSTRVNSLAGGAIIGCSTNITNGSTCPDSTGLALVTLTAGSGMAVYEVYFSDAFSWEQLSVPVVVAYTANATNNLPAAGLQTTVLSSFGPLSQVATASATDPVPRFVINTTVPQNLFTITKAASSYTGSVETANCQTFSGWAADRARLGQSISVSIYDGTTFLTNIVANQSRPDIGATLGDNGLHGFSYAVPFALHDAKSHSFHVVYETTTIDLPGSPKTLTCEYKFTGNVDSTSCSAGISGWAADRARPNIPISVSLWESGILKYSTLASGSRSDVGAVLGDNGLHAFNFPIPNEFLDGRTHTLQLQYESTATQLSGSPVSLTCFGSLKYVGAVDSASCAGVSGWVADQNRPNQAITITLWDGNLFLASATANLSRSDVGRALGDNGLHGFRVAVPYDPITGGNRLMQIRFENSIMEVPGPKVTLPCTSSGTLYAGNIDKASCSGITGWAADQARLNVPIAVSLWDGTTQIAIVTANASRADVGSAIGDNGLHGFTLPIPSAYANGVSHALQVYYELSTTAVLGSTVNLTCGSSGPSYAGHVDVASCSGISGWVADTNRLNTPITVSLWLGTTQIASTTANGSRGDVGTAIGDNGLHGFTLQIPAAYANNVSHALQVHYESTATQVAGAPITLTCGFSGGTNYAGNIDASSCSGVVGWAADRNRLNTPIVVTLWDGTLEVSGAYADGLRGDVGAVIGDNGLHGYTVPIPPGYANGISHTLQLRFDRSSQAAGPPVTIKCGALASYAGAVDVLSCSTILGWAADRNNLNSAISVTAFDGEQPLFTTPATGLRPDVGAVLGDNGLHGFGVTFHVPTDGKPHVVTVRPFGSSTPLPGGQTLTCQP